MEEIQQPVTTLVVARDEGITQSTTANTPGLQPNVIITTVQPIVFLLVRVCRTYLQTLVGLMGVGMTKAGQDVLGAHDFWQLLQVSAGLSVGAAGMSLLQNLLELAAKFDQSHPTLHG